MNLTEEQHNRLRQSVKDFKRSMEIRSNLNLRVAIRVTSLLRVGMISLAIISVIFMLMLWVMTSRMGYILDIMGTMNKQFTSMAHDMTAMRRTIMAMDQNVSELPVIVDEIEKMQNTVSVLNQDIQNISVKMHTIEKDLNHITDNIGNMTNTFRSLDPNVQSIGVGVSRMSRPMKFYNRIFPFP